MLDTQKRIKKVEELIKQAAIELVHPSVRHTTVEVESNEIVVCQNFDPIFGCWWTFYKIIYDEDGFVTYTYFGDNDYPDKKQLSRYIGFEKAVLKILQENL